MPRIVPPAVDTGHWRLHLSIGTTPRKWLLEWALVGSSILLTGAGAALLVASYFVPPTSSREAAQQRSELEARADSLFDARGIDLDVSDMFPGDTGFQRRAEGFWVQRRYEVPRGIRKAALVHLGLAAASMIVALSLRARRTRTAGYARLTARIMQGDRISDQP